MEKAAGCRAPGVGQGSHVQIFARKGPNSSEDQPKRKQTDARNGRKNKMAGQKKHESKRTDKRVAEERDGTKKEEDEKNKPPGSAALGREFKQPAFREKN